MNKQKNKNNLPWEIYRFFSENELKELNFSCIAIERMNVFLQERLLKEKRQILIFAEGKIENLT